jgi:complex iron-sulfur molybdoenzyme family reductase subunit alpha
VDCYPGGCPWRVYVRDGKIVREEQSGTLQVVQEGVPDMNPMGCQKGACWSYIHYAPERVTKPLKRAGERGEGKWQEVSWDEALTDIADAMLDAAQDQAGVHNHSHDARGCGFRLPHLHQRLGLAHHGRQR